MAAVSSIGSAIELLSNDDWKDKYLMIEVMTCPGTTMMALSSFVNEVCNSVQFSHRVQLIFYCFLSPRCCMNTRQEAVWEVVANPNLTIPTYSKRE